LLAQIYRLLDGEMLAEVDVIVRNRERGLGRGRGGFAIAGRERTWEMGCTGESGSGYGRGFEEGSARIGMGHK
jgi:hypothetical protein